MKSLEAGSQVFRITVEPPPLAEAASAATTQFFPFVFAA
jgi:hypothetical protein